MRCEFESGACIYCETAAPAKVRGKKFARNCPARPKPAPCPHLGPQVQRKSDAEQLTIEVTCDTCGGKRKQVAQPLHECALFRRCLPTYRPSAEQRREYEARPDAVRLCDGCPRQ